MKKVFLIVAVTFWTVSIGIAFAWLADYSAKPGIPAKISAKLPYEIFRNSNSKLPKILLFLHPQCPCSQSTLAELERLVGKTKDLANIKIIFYKPDNSSSEWIETGIWRRSLKIPYAEISTMNEAEIEKFGVTTSGQTLLYDADDNLIFSGGITLARAFEGDNKGKKTIETYLLERKILATETPVFGCSLTTSEKTVY